MNSNQNEPFIKVLNADCLLVTFEDVTWHNGIIDAAEADYFGKIIHVIFPGSAIAINAPEPAVIETFQIRLYDLDLYGTYNMIYEQLFDQDFPTCASVVRAVNAYIRTRPFTILWHDQGQYQLLDPNGMDFTGELISLKDARRTCANNYLIR